MFDSHPRIVTALVGSLIHIVIRGFAMVLPTDVDIGPLATPPIYKSLRTPTRYAGLYLALSVGFDSGCGREQAGFGN